MKRAVIYVIIAVFLLFVPNLTQAALTEINNGSGHVMYDSVAKQYWVWDLTAFVGQTYSEQLTTISNNYVATNYFGNNTWHMASHAEALTLFNNPALDIEQFNPSGTSTNPTNGYTQVNWYGRWVGQDTILGPIGVMHDSLGYNDYMGGVLDDHLARYSNVGAWVATAPVPLPSALLLLGPGLVGLAAMRRRFKK